MAQTSDTYIAIACLSHPNIYLLTLTILKNPVCHNHSLTLFLSHTTLNKIVFLKRHDMSGHDLVSDQTSNICINRIYCVCQTICVVTSSNFLGRLVQCEQKGGQGEVGWYIHPKGENSMAVCWFDCKNSSVWSLHKWSWKTVISPNSASMQLCSSAIN